MKWLDSQGAARYLGFEDVQFIRENALALRGVKLGGQWRFAEEELDQALLDMRAQQQPQTTVPITVTGLTPRSRRILARTSGSP